MPVSCEVLLGLAAQIFGVARAKRVDRGAKTLGGLAALVGGFAVVTDSAAMALGREAVVPSPLAGGSGVLATGLLALCLPRRPDDPA